MPALGQDQLSGQDGRVFTVEAGQSARFRIMFPNGFEKNAAEVVSYHYVPISARADMPVVCLQHLPNGTGAMCASTMLGFHDEDGVELSLHACNSLDDQGKRYEYPSRKLHVPVWNYELRRLQLGVFGGPKEGEFFTIDYNARPDVSGDPRYYDYLRTAQKREGKYSKRYLLQAQLDTKGSFIIDGTTHQVTPQFLDRFFAHPIIAAQWEEVRPMLKQGTFTTEDAMNVVERARVFARSVGQGPSRAPTVPATSSPRVDGGLPSGQAAPALVFGAEQPAAAPSQATEAALAFGQAETPAGATPAVDLSAEFGGASPPPAAAAPQTPEQQASMFDFSA